MSLGVMNLAAKTLEIDGVEVVKAVPAHLRPSWGWKHAGGRWASEHCLHATPADALRDAARYLRITVVDTID